MYDVTVKMESEWFDISLQVESLGQTKELHTIKEDSKFSGLGNSVDIDAFYRLGKGRVDFGLYIKILYGVGFSHPDFYLFVRSFYM